MYLSSIYTKSTTNNYCWYAIRLHQDHAQMSLAIVMHTVKTYATPSQMELTYEK